MRGCILRSNNFAFVHVPYLSPYILIGVWRKGKYHGHGRKLYSRGGGYEGGWEDGRRQGSGISFYGDGSLGGHGILRWEGPFVDNLAHGVGQAYVAAKFEDEHERWSGDTAVKGPLIAFDEGRPLNFPTST